MFDKRLLFLLLLFSCGSLTAQTGRPDFAKHPEASAGIYCSYVPRITYAPVPKGFKPFYISHFSRHGSRWHSSDRVYNTPLAVVREAAGKAWLTPRGTLLLKQLETLAADAENRYGDLSPRGVAEHRGVAERMYATYPEVFSTRHGRVCRIESRSTVVVRCVLSMAAFNERLKELNPALKITRESSMRYMGYLSNAGVGEAERYAALMKVADSMSQKRIHPEAFMKRIFTQPDSIKSPARFMSQIYALASDTQDVDYLNISLYDLFTPDELYDLWSVENAARYLSMGPSMRFGNQVMDAARPLLKNIIETADSVIAGKCDLSASLRFGHDTGITPLLALMGVKYASDRVWSVDDVANCWQLQYVTPMCNNLQLIFFRNAAGEVRVRVLHNEEDVGLPVEGGPYYPWSKLRAYLVSR